VTERSENVSPMPRLTKSYHIKARDFIRAGEASINIQNLLKSMDFDPRLIRRVAICGYEGEMNVVMHGGDGTLSIELDDEKLTLEISDDGPGIEAIELAMQAGYSTANDDHREMGFGAGMGLPNMKKNSDHIHIESLKNNGTVVRMLFMIPEKGETD
ncbi:MAG: ATP-binding protein, partial [Desulfobacterales bacterium]